MEDYEIEVKLRVRVNAFNDSDALDAVMDVFAIGENDGMTIVDCEYQELGKKKK